MLVLLKSEIQKKLFKVSNKIDNRKIHHRLPTAKHIRLNSICQLNSNMRAHFLAPTFVSDNRAQLQVLNRCF